MTWYRRQRWPLRLLVVVAVAAALFWATTVGGMLMERRPLIYRFDAWRTTVDQVRGPGRLERIEGADGTSIALWVVPAPDGAPPRPTVIHFGGNVGVLHRSVSRTRALSQAGYPVVVMNYRGASGEPGTPSEAAITADALATYDALPDLGLGEHPPAVYGASLGAGVAVRLAERRPVAGVVLAAPFARLCEVAEHHYPWVPACLVMWDERWDSIERIRAVDAPLLVLHGARDRVIPATQAEALFAAAAEPKRLEIYPRASHRDLAFHGAETAILDFLADLPLPGS